MMWSEKSFYGPQKYFFFKTQYSLHLQKILHDINNVTKPLAAAGADIPL